MKRRLTSFATVTLAAVVSAAIVAVAPVQAQGMTSVCVGAASTERPKAAPQQPATPAAAIAKTKAHPATPGGV